MSDAELTEAMLRENFIRATTREPRVTLADLDWDAFESLGEDGDTGSHPEDEANYDASA